ECTYLRRTLLTYLFPYTTLFRSCCPQSRQDQAAGPRGPVPGRLAAAAVSAAGCRTARRRARGSPGPVPAATGRTTASGQATDQRSEEHTYELQSQSNLV